MVSGARKAETEILVSNFQNRPVSITPAPKEKGGPCHSKSRKGQNYKGGTSSRTSLALVVLVSFGERRTSRRARCCPQEDA